MKKSSCKKWVIIGAIILFILIVSAVFFLYYSKSGRIYSIFSNIDWFCKNPVETTPNVINEINLNPFRK